MEAYREFALSYVQVVRQVKKFKRGQEGVDDDPCSGRSLTSQTKIVTCIINLLNFNRRAFCCLMILDKYSENRSTSHCYGRIEHTKDVCQVVLGAVDRRSKNFCTAVSSWRNTTQQGCHNHLKVSTQPRPTSFLFPRVENTILIITLGPIQTAVKTALLTRLPSRGWGVRPWDC